MISLALQLCIAVTGFATSSALRLVLPVKRYVEHSQQTDVPAGSNSCPGYFQFGVHTGLANEPKGTCNVQCSMLTEQSKIMATNQQFIRSQEPLIKGIKSVFIDRDLTSSPTVSKLQIECNEEAKYMLTSLNDTSHPDTEGHVWQKYLGPVSVSGEAKRVWSKCGPHLSATVIPTTNTKKLSVAREQLKKVQYRSRPPNVYIFTYDSTSRGSFYRSLPRTVEFLRDLARNKRSEVFDFVRYSAVDWGTPYNVAGLFRGCSSGPASKNWGTANSRECLPQHIHLDEEFEKLGYVKLVEHTPYPKFWQSHCPNCTTIGTYMGYRGDWNTQVEVEQVFTGSMIASEVELLETLKSAYEREAPEVPQFFALHNDDNHCPTMDCLNAHHDSQILRTLRLLDLENSIVLLSADHGKYHGTGIMQHPISATFEGRNPFSLLLLPPSSSPSYLGKDRMRTIAENQQRLITHYDMHEFLLNTIKSYQPTSSDSSTAPVYGVDFSREILPVDRTCEDVGVAPGFCFCNVPVPVNVNFPKSGDMVRGLLNAGISSVNNYTGAGELQCVKLDSAKFEVLSILASTDDTTCEGVLCDMLAEQGIEGDGKHRKRKAGSSGSLRNLADETALSEMDEASLIDAELFLANSAGLVVTISPRDKVAYQGRPVYQVGFNANGKMHWVTDKFGSTRPDVERIDSFSDECCLSDNAFGAAAVTFKTQPLSQQENDALNLRLCRCKCSVM